MDQNLYKEYYECYYCGKINCNGFCIYKDVLESLVKISKNYMDILRVESSLKDISEIHSNKIGCHMLSNKVCEFMKFLKNMEIRRNKFIKERIDEINRINDNDLSDFVALCFI